ncbi:hypothetical protein [Caloramator sp. ALD01]|uniref:hypothetical protein n=1 Tax=Caloramator sp. ALD01 TaxID=1031288 RepID=UPI0003FBC1F9|nr:hypothetical protein [Caloramator sp. ALD01]
MEFLGFEAQDFEYFKNLEKNLNDEYLKQRENVKTNFRAFCYELQKIYHKHTNGFLELEKDFLKSNKKSDNLKARHRISENAYIDIVINQYGVGIYYNTQNKEIISNSKDKIWNYILSNKKSFISLNRITKTKCTEIIKINCLEMNSKAYDNIKIVLEENKEDKLNLYIGAFYTKSECIKQKRQLANHFYEEFLKIYDLCKTL